MTRLHYNTGTSLRTPLSIGRSRAGSRGAWRFGSIGACKKEYALGVNDEVGRTVHPVFRAAHSGNAFSCSVCTAAPEV